jgi:hypothetical protein
MKSSNVSWPHPVLGNSDDIEGACSVNISCKIENNILHFKSENIAISNDYFEKLVKDKHASVVFKLSSNSTLFMRQFEDVLDVQIECSLVSKKIDVDIFIIAKTDINKFSDSSFHPDTRLGENKGVFSIESGTIIGDAGRVTINLDDEYRKGISGIIEFEELSSDLPLSIDVDGTKILIKYPNDPSTQNIVTTFTSGKKQFVNVFLNLFILPAFTEAFNALIDAQSEGKYDELVEKWDWARFIDENTSERITTSDNSLERAQIFLQEVIEKSTGQVEPVPIYKAFNEIFK